MFFQLLDSKNEKYNFLLETVKSEKLSPQAIPVAFKEVFSETGSVTSDQHKCLTCAQQLGAC